MTQALINLSSSSIEHIMKMGRGCVFFIAAINESILVKVVFSDSLDEVNRLGGEMQMTLTMTGQRYKSIYEKYKCGHSRTQARS